MLRAWSDSWMFILGVGNEDIALVESEEKCWEIRREGVQCNARFVTNRHAMEIGYCQEILCVEEVQL